MNKQTKSIDELHHLFKTRQLSPVEHVKETFDVIEEVNPTIRAFVQLNKDKALKAAQKAENNYRKGIIKSPLQGITVGVKDVIHTKDMPVTMETELYYENPIWPKQDATSVKKLRQAGAIIIGKTNNHEMGMGPTGDIGYSGHSKNPYNLNKVTGGSSSGSAAAIAAGLVDVTLGSDTGGSIRLPSALSANVGMKPTFGRVSNEGFSPLSYSCDAIGPMTKTIRDNAHVLNVISGYDPVNMYSQSFNSTQFLPDSPLNHSRQIKVGVPFAWLEERLDPQVRENTKAVIQTVKDLGHSIIDVNQAGYLPTRKELDTLRKAHQTVLISEGYHAHQAELQHPGKFAEAIYQRLLTGNTKTVDYVEAYQQKHKLIAMYRKMYEDIDIFLTPAVTLPACDLYENNLEVEGETHTTMTLYTEFTWFDSFTGNPSLALPSGFTKEGLPLGILLNGAYGSEASLYQFGALLEKAFDLKLRPYSS